MTKVLFLAHWYPSQQDPAQGLFVREHARAIAGAGVDLHVVHVQLVSGRWGTRISIEAVPGETFRHTRIVIASPFWKAIFMSYPWQWRIVRRAFVQAGIDPASYDLVHSNVVHPSGVIGARLAAWGGIPQVISEHWTRLAHYFAHGFLRGDGRKAYATAAMIMPVSADLAGEVERFAGPATKVEVVPNVVPGEWFKYAPKESSDEIRLVMIARWDTTKVPHKRPDLVIDAVAALQGELQRPVRLIFIGNGDRINELEQRAARQQVRVSMPGHCSKERIAAELCQADLFLHPSERETFAVVVAEALKCGTPVVASEVGAVPELVSPAHGVLVKNTVEAWVQGIRKALATTYDRAGIAEHWSHRFTYKAVGERTAALYRQVLGSRSV